MPRSRSSFRKGSTRSKMRFNACVASRNNALSSCRSGRWRRCGSLPGDARRLASRICDFCRRDRRRAPVRYAETADVLPRSCPGGKPDRRYGPTEWPHLGGQPARTASAHRGGLDIPLSRERQRALESPAGSVAKPVRDIAWKAQIRLCASYRRLSATGKKLSVVVAAIAREMAAFLWAIGREVAPA